jgi:excisionase family DNA binding protein
MKKFYTPAQIAEIMSVTRETVYNLIKEGKLNSYKFGGVVRISEEQLLQSLESANG